MTKPILALDPTHYPRHSIHTSERNWAETNCYTDVWIELLHAWGFEPIAALPFTLAIDFEGDQWTFFKFPLFDLNELFGLDVQELAIWRPLVSHIEEQVEQGRPVLVELDSFFLPDTAGTAYQMAHVKSTVGVNQIDVANRRLGYFHNQGYYELRDPDFSNVFQLGQQNDPGRLPPYVEFVKLRGRGKRESELLEASIGLLRRHLQLAPEENPFHRFRTAFEADLKWLAAEGLETFHRYSFATLRQFGACYELSATYFNWLRSLGLPGLDSTFATFTDLSAGAKSLQFQLARAMGRQKPMVLTGLDSLAAQWQSTITDLKARFGV
jgi:hypothetical protein